MGCKFCASAGIPFSRSLSAGEILGQVIAVSKHENVRIGHIVIMGIGEPLDNYDNVVKFLRRVTAERILDKISDDELSAQGRYQFRRAGSFLRSTRSRTKSFR